MLVNNKYGLRLFENDSQQSNVLLGSARAKYCCLNVRSTLFRNVEGDNKIQCRSYDLCLQYIWSAYSFWRDKMLREGNG